MTSLLFFLYIIIVFTGLLVFGAWLLRYFSARELPPERRTLFVVLIMACLTFIAFMVGMNLKPAPAPPQQATGQPAQAKPDRQPPPPDTSAALPEQQPDAAVPEEDAPLINKDMTEEQRLQLFEMEHYPKLYEQRIALNRKIKAFKDFTREANQLSRHTPKHRPLLETIYRIRQAAYQKMHQQNISVSKHLREFWVHYNTGNSHHAMQTFNPLAKKLTLQIRTTLGELKENDRQEMRVLQRHMNKAAVALKRHELPDSRLTAYTRQNRNNLMQWLQLHGPNRTLDALNNLLEQRILINDRMQSVRRFKQRYTDIRTRLNRTLRLWQQARDANYYAEYRLLYAVESLYIVEQLNLTEGMAAARKLRQVLEKDTDQVAGYADQQLVNAEQAYRPAS